MGLSNTTKLTIATAGIAAIGLAAFFVYDRGYNTGYSDARLGHQKYASNKVRDGLLYDTARAFVPDSIAASSVEKFNKIRDNILERYDAMPPVTVDEAKRVNAAMDVFDKRENIVIPSEVFNEWKPIVPACSDETERILKNINDFLTNPNAAVEKETKTKEKKTAVGTTDATSGSKTATTTDAKTESTAEAKPSTVKKATKKSSSSAATKTTSTKKTTSKKNAQQKTTTSSDKPAAKKDAADKTSATKKTDKKTADSVDKEVTE